MKNIYIKEEVIFEALRFWAPWYPAVIFRGLLYSLGASVGPTIHYGLRGLQNLKSGSEALIAGSEVPSWR